MSAVTEAHVELLFNWYDKDHNGTLEEAELLLVVKAITKKTDVDSVKAMEVWDTDGDKSVSVSEATKRINAIAQKAPQLVPRIHQVVSTCGSIAEAKFISQAEKLFECFDKDGNGKLDAGEVKAVVEAIKPSKKDVDMAKMMRAWDTDGNNEVDKAEFCNRVKAIAENCKTLKYEAAVDKMFEMMQTFIDHPAPESIVVVPATPQEEKQFEAEFEVDVDDVDTLFNYYDADRNGTLEPAEMLLMLKVVTGKEDPDPNKFMNMWDTDENGHVDRAECLKRLNEMIKSPKYGKGIKSRVDALINHVSNKDKLDEGKFKQKATELFASFDSDGNGVLDATEFKIVVKALLPDKQHGKKEMARIMKDWDKDGDTKITKEEFQGRLLEMVNQSSDKTVAGTMAKEMIARMQKQIELTSIAKLMSQGTRVSRSDGKQVPVDEDYDADIPEGKILEKPKMVARDSGPFDHPDVEKPSCSVPLLSTATLFVFIVGGSHLYKKFCC